MMLPMTPEQDVEIATGYDLPTAQSLVRLRLLTEDAARRVDDISEAGRHQALIALDGACEHALWLAVRQAGVRLKGDQRAGVPALYRAVIEQRRDWVNRPGFLGGLDLPWGRVEFWF
jgi:hypothetical protein